MESRARRCALEHLRELADHRVVERMAAFEGDDFALDGAAQKIQIADQIEHFVADAFVGEAVLGVDRAVDVEDEDIAGLEIFVDEVAGAKGFGLGLGDKGAGWGDFLGIAAVELIGHQLLADRLNIAVIQVVENLEFVSSGWGGNQRRAAIANFNGGRDGQELLLRRLIDNPRVLEGLDKRKAAAIHPRHFRAIDLYFQIINPQPRDRGHAMLNSLDRIRTCLNGRTSGTPRDVLDERRDADWTSQIRPDKDDAMPYRRRLEGEGGLRAGEEAASREGGLVRAMVFCGQVTLTVCEVLPRVAKRGIMHQ